MNFLTVTLLTLVAVAFARHITLEDVIDLERNSAYGHTTRFGIPFAEKVRKAEEEASRDPSRIVGGSLAGLGQFPYQAGLLTLFPSGSTHLAGGILISTTRVLTAAHNLINTASATQVTVVLGSTTIFTGGTRLVSTDYVLHANYNPVTYRNDVAMINLPFAVSISGFIAPIALPSGSQLNEDFSGEIVVASGFGQTLQGIGINQQLRFTQLSVVPIDECVAMLPTFFSSSHVCTRDETESGKNVCIGDSGGPIVVTRNNSPLLIGVFSFVTTPCDGNGVAGFSRVTSFMNWINQHL